jgi:predicted neutral ceramidase superfamily lipid hydrolase
MKKNKRYFKSFLLTALGLVGIHIGLIQTFGLGLGLIQALQIDGFVVILFLLSSLIAAPSLDKDPEQFALRYLLLTTLQLLAPLGAVVFWMVSKVDHVQALGLNMVAMFGLFLTFQSIYFIRLIRS